MKAISKLIIFCAIILTLLLSSCSAQNLSSTEMNSNFESISDISSDETVSYTLQTLADGGKLLYIGIGGSIDGVINPDLIVAPESVVKIVLINGDGMPHDLFLPDFDVKSEYVKKIGESIEFVVDVRGVQPGTYVYYCTVPGHRQAGQEGKFILSGADN